MKTKSPVNCLAVSADGTWIAAGTRWGEVFVWDMETRTRVFQSHDSPGDYRNSQAIYAVDFSPDMSRLVTASSDCRASVWDIATGKRVLLLHDECKVTAAKYSPQGDRIATATPCSVRIYDSNDGRLLVDTRVKVTSLFNNGLFWSNNHLFVVSDGKITQLEASAGSTVLEWPVSGTNNFSCIALPKHGRFIAYSTERTVTFWDNSTRTQLGLVQRSQDIRSIAVSPDDRYIAVGGEDKKIIVKDLSHIETSTGAQGQQNSQPWKSARHGDNLPNSSPENPLELQGLPYVDDHIPLSPPHRDEGAAKLSSLPRTADSVLLSPLHPTFPEPDFQIDSATFNSWKQDQLTYAEALLTAAIAVPRNTSHHLFASRALVRARLREWDAALLDAEQAIKVQPSVIAYIAKSMALVGKGERHKGYRTCDIAVARFHPSHVTFLLLIKAIVVFMAGEHNDAISRVDDLIATAYMYLLLATSRMQRGNYGGAIESFEHARAQMRQYESQPLLMISLISGWRFDLLGFMIRQGLCKALYAAGRTKDAADCFHQMTSELGGETNQHGDRLEWNLDFCQRSSEKLERLGDTAADSQRHDEAISHYTTVLSLDPPSPHSILTKRSKAYLATGSWKQALDDANQAIRLDPSFPWGYEMKHAALHKAGEYDSATNAFEAMLLKIAQSPDQDVQRRGDKYVNPSSARATIRRIVQRVLRHSPPVLIDTTTGRLHNKAEQASAFESLPIFNELVSSTTTRIDYVRIKHEVRQYFRYVMLSHKWEENEPLFQKVIHIAVYDLGESPTHDKLQTFCKIVRDGGFNWAWNDTCCIDKSDHFVLQEALVAMFKWYQGSALVIVFLRGVRSSSQLGALVRSIWNTRAWTLQEYVAAKVLHFYTEDWTPYLGLQLPNHKESPEVISEMEQATGVSAEQLKALRPGLTFIREKLRLASTRETTLVEDAAYSLLGIFSVAGLPAIYGEGEASLGRLLAHVLAGSGDVSILAWTGESGSFNSCLPADITVFNGPATSHLPSPIPDADMERTITASHNPSFDLNAALSLYDRLHELPAPWFAASRMKLPCIAFQLPPLSPYRTRSGRVYRADTLVFGAVKIKTRHDLSRMDTLYLVHPWLDTLLEREERGGEFVREDFAPPFSPYMVEDSQQLFDIDDEEEIPDDEIDDSPTSVLESRSLYSPPSRMDRETRARRLVAHLRQPFGALLLTLASTGGRAVDYKRIATDSMITVQFQEDVSLADILDNVRTLDVL
ncbi:hypothetical protein L210DRAFT_3645803 [Boletus edulis BED1]|uniref:Heterokaryon incompatibility domain-containing protein n=1 Tax=Boletus edulis BED1 TaxID=1328754 RepID=A0AAD4GER3_BOLED|nr:hypothetical protein L210DRAFT_3645803 [Boletus edulis BED1]